MKSSEKNKGFNKRVFFKHFFLICISLLFLILALFLFWVSSLKIPAIDDNFSNVQNVASTKVYDRTGEILLFDFYQDVKRTPVKSEEISQFAKDAVIAIEDNQFYSHKGVNWKSTIRSVFYTMLSYLHIGNKEVQGGSTITQQVIKNILLTREKKIDRKIKEWSLALKLEKTKTKNEILTLYLNEIPYGGEIYGIQEASEIFFDKKALDLTLAESAYLASIINAPSFYSPYGKNRESLDNRKNTVINEMFKFGFIDEEQAKEAKQEIVVFKEKPITTIKAPHFVQYVRSYVEQKYGLESTTKGGLKIITTLDYELQEKAEEIILRNSLKNQEDWNASNAGLIAIENNTGQILTMVGSRNYFEKEIDGSFNITTAQRQPGSAFKPFVYSAGFEKGYTMNTILFDLAVQFSTACSESNFSSDGKCYSPGNYDNKYLGPLTIRQALAQSRNIPAVKMLYLVGIENAINTAKKMGINTLTKSADHYGLSLVLGGGEVTLLELTSAYSTFPNEGIHFEPTAILKVIDKNGIELESYGPRKTSAINPESARKISSILSDNDARTPLFGSRSFLYFGNSFSVAGKTGTTNDNRDAWLIGYTDQVSVGVWSGNSDNSPMKKGSSISGKPWREFMDEVNKKYKPGFFNSPIPESNNIKPILRGVWEGSESVLIDTVSGKKATDLTPKETLKEIILKNPQPILYWVDKNDPRGPIPENKTSDPQYFHWKYSIDKWIKEKGVDISNPIIPEEFDDIHTENNQPKATIITPINNQSINDDLLVSLETESVFPIQKIKYFLNGQLIKEINSNFSSPLWIDKDTITTYKGNAVLSIEITDSVYNKITVDQKIAIN